MKLSVVIPLGPRDEVPLSLVTRLREEIPDVELILSAGPVARSSSVPVTVITGPLGRAHQLNAGARRASGEYLWFLHADSGLAHDTITSLKSVIERSTDCLWFFSLRFGDGSRLMRITEGGVRLRSEILKIPFGDQGFLLSRRTFDRLGNFDAGAKFGEDHLMVWKAHRLGIPVRCTGGSLVTSARKYDKGGWLRVTGRHLFMTWGQAAPELWRLGRMKCGR